MIQQIFYCTSPTGKVNNKSWVYLECDRWFDARKVAYTLFGTDQVNFKSVDERPGPSVHQGNGYTLKWVGSPMDPANQPELKVIPWVSEAESSKQPQDSSSSSLPVPPAPEKSSLPQPPAETSSRTSKSGTSSGATPTKSSKLNGARTKSSLPSAPAGKTKSRSRGG